MRLKYNYLDSLILTKGTGLSAIFKLHLIQGVVLFCEVKQLTWLDKLVLGGSTAAEANMRAHNNQFQQRIMLRPHPFTNARCSGINFGQ